LPTKAIDMKTLYIVRHAKSSWDTPGLPDAERPLMEKGKKRSKKVIDYLLKHKVSIDLILCSHAVRSFETAKIFAHALKVPAERILIHQHIYHSDADGLFNEFYDLDNEIQSAMIVGHNPSITTFANYFLKKKTDWLSTSSVVCIEIKTDKWEELASASSKVQFVLLPKEM
jgi:phosphohistidine phosphatase